jgi:hypothetical protein
MVSTAAFLPDGDYAPTALVCESFSEAELRHGLREFPQRSRSAHVPPRVMGRDDASGARATIRRGA